jgi:UDP-N-acetylglucosamine 2-epimerase (non-hydrolysing)
MKQSVKKIFILIGTRPNFIKVTRFKELGEAKGMDIKIIHTGQHFDANMADVFFTQFGLQPDYFLNVGGQTPNTQIANIILKLEELFAKKGKPDLFIVPGDVNSTMAGAIAANKLGVKLAHLESGLRSYDKKMPEEHNRIITDNLSDICFVTEPSGIENLENENIAASVEYVGNTMIDTLVHFEPQIEASDVLERYNVDKGDYHLLTFHRPSNVDSEEELIILIEIINAVAKFGKMVLPLHPRTRNKLKEFGLLTELENMEELVLTEPIGYFEFQKLIKYAKVVLTDSGGVQEETTFRQVPCLTLRENTERPVTIIEGTNTLVPINADSVKRYLKEIEEGNYKIGAVPYLWDGKATERILELI